MQEGASGSSARMQSETWQAEGNRGEEEESWVRAAGAGGWERGAMDEEAQGRSPLQREGEKIKAKKNKQHGRKHWVHDPGCGEKEEEEEEVIKWKNRSIVLQKYCGLHSPDVQR